MNESEFESVKASPLFRFEKWNRLHHHPCGSDISSQRSSELFASITEADRMKFFELHGKRSEDTEYWCYDTTSISSYSRELNQVRPGYNKEHDPFAQLNLALIFGEKSRFPLYYRKLAGNIPDVKTVRQLLADLKNIGFSLPALRGNFKTPTSCFELLFENQIRSVFGGYLKVATLKLPDSAHQRSFSNHSVDEF